MLMLVLLCGLAYIELRRNFRSKFILRLLECMLFCVFWNACYFASFGVQNLFCVFWSACYFASFGVQNLFCFGAIGVQNLF